MASVSYANAQIAKYTEKVSSYPAQGAPLDPAKVKALSGKTVMFVPLTTESQLVQQQAGAIKAALRHVGVSMVTCDPEYNPTDAAKCLASAKPQGASAVITAGWQHALLPNAYAALAAQHIPVVVTAQGPDAPANNQYAAYFDQLAPLVLEGRLEADEIIARSNGAAHVLLLNFTNPPYVAQQQAVLGEFTKYCPQCTVKTIATAATTGAAQQRPSEISSALIGDPSIKYVFEVFDQAYQTFDEPGVVSAHATDRITLVGTTGTASNLQMLQNNQGWMSDAGMDIPYSGYQIADTLLRLLTGLPSAQDPYIPVRVFDSQNLAGIKLSSSMDVGPLYGDDSYAQAFYNTWSGKS